MYLEILTPDRQIFQGEVSSVQLPGTDGFFQILKGHTPIIATLRQGPVKVSLKSHAESKDQNQQVIDIAGGVVEVMNNNIIVLAH